MVHREEEMGAVTVIVIALILVFIGAAAFAVDTGLAYAKKRQLSVAADSASLAAARAVSAALPPGTACTEANKTTLGLVAAAQNAATTFNLNNELDGSIGAPTASVDCSDPDQILVRVDNEETVATVFADSLGLISFTPPGAAISTVFIPNQFASGLRPFAACVDFVTAGLQTNKPFVVNIHKTEAICGTSTPGEWGWVNFQEQSDFNPIDDPTCGSAGGSTTCAREWVEHGFQGPVYFPNLIAEDGGLGWNSGFALNPVKTELESLIGLTILLPIADAYEQPKMDLTGVVAVKVCGVRGKTFQYPANADTTASACGPRSEPIATDLGFVNWDSDDANDGALFVMPVEEITSSPVGGPREDCFGDPACDTGLRAVTLYR
jgi:hypothetical protein